MAEPAGKAAPKKESSATPGLFIDPYRAYSFKLVITGLMEAHFTQCSGLGMRVEPIEYAEGGSTKVYHVPGRTRCDPITLYYGLTQSHELWDWMNSISKGTAPMPRKDINILLFDPDGVTEKVRWTLYNAWPCAWRGATLNALVSEVAIESVEFTYESVARQD
jgi:phage tail-like protein